MKLTSERRSAMLKRFLIALAPLALCVALASIFAALTARGAEDEPAAVAATTTQALSVPAQGPTSPEELVFLSEIVARVRLVSAELGSLPYYGEPAHAFVFRFRVVEYLKGSGGDELTVRVLAKYPNRTGYVYTDSRAPDADLALRTAKYWFAQRDTRWDDREALAFLRSSTMPREAGFYEFAWRRPGPTWLDDYAITSAHNRAWLPSTAPPGDAAFASLEPRYFTHALADSVSPPKWPASSISLSEIESLIEANADMVANGHGIPGYEECVRERFETDAVYKKYPPQMSFLERHIPSGKPAGHRLWPIPAGGRPGFYYGRWWTTGPDSDLFAHRITDDPDNDPTTGYATEHVTLRPIPKGVYKVFVNDQPSQWVPCDYNPEVSNNLRDMTIHVTAPSGTLHEAFFDPAAMDGGGVGADGDNGVLKPATLSVADGTGISFQSVAWRQSAVEMRIEPHLRLPGYHADFIALDGSVSLRLDFDDAIETREGGSLGLSWPVCVQRWEAGDLLMLRIRESPPDLIGVTRDIGCANAPTPTPATPN